MSQKFPILLYHRVGERDGSFMDNYTISPETFARQMNSIKCAGWQPVPLEDALSTGDRKVPNKSLALTFDDGFASNRDHAWPLLQEYAFPAATFIVTDCLGSVNSWDGPSRASYPLLSVKDIAAADPSLMTFHSHGASHADLTFMTRDFEALQRELLEPRRQLAAITGAGHLFAYPRGSWNWRVMEQVRASGYAGACTCMEGFNSPRTNPFLLRRIEMRERDVGWRFWLKIHLGRDIVSWPPNRPPEITLWAAWLRRNR